MLSAEDIKTICICGAGTMGSGIAQLSAMAGFQTIQFDVQAAMLEKSRMSIEQALQKLLEKNKITAEEKQRAVSNITFTTNIAQCKADVIIEAIVEKKEAKIGLFNQLAAINNGEAVLATNTSSISVSEIASATASASKVAGMHFFNPAPLMKLVEVVRANDTSGSVIEILVAVARKMGKVPVVCKDSPGFIVNRVARHYYLESMWLVEQGLATIEAVDAIMESTGFKMGPFKLMDLIGMDINLAVSESLYNAFDKAKRFEPSPIQVNKVKSGELGRKTGKGFYDYSKA